MSRSALAAAGLSLLLAGCISNPFHQEPSHPAAKAAPPAAPSAAPPAAGQAAPSAAPPGEAPAATPIAATSRASRAEWRLAYGVRAYDDGDYKKARLALQGALNQGLSGTHAKVKAYKYLAFVACAEGQRNQCKSHFQRAFAIDPQFHLTKAEAGHPVWGPVFLEARAEARRKAKAGR